MKRRIIVGAGVVVLAAGGVYFAWSPAQIWYHKRALDQIHAEVYSAPSTLSDGLVGYGNGELFDQEDRHKNRLASLGYFFHQRYEMEKVADTGEAHRALWRLVQQEFPDRRYPLLSYPDNVLEVWDLAVHKPAWDAFAQKYNVVDLVVPHGADAADQRNHQPAREQLPVTASVPATDVTKSMLGRWGTDGEPVLIISLDGDRVVISTPPNDTWRMEIHNAKIISDLIHFVQTNYLHSGEAHPFSGVACQSMVKLIDGDTLQFSVNTEHLPEPQVEMLTRLE
jgi:hypothetical protein